MRKWLRMGFVVLLAWPVVRVWLGLSLRHRERLPRHGPAIIVANHSSHLDILALLCLFPLASIPTIHAVAAIDYFCRNRWLKWFALNWVGIIPLARTPAKDDNHPLQACFDALEQNRIVIVFPEGTRSIDQQLGPLKCGIWYLAKRFPQVPVIPVYLHGLGRAMPKGSRLPVPLFVRVAVGRAQAFQAEKDAYLDHIKQGLLHLQRKVSHQKRVNP